MFVKNSKANTEKFSETSDKHNNHLAITTSLWPFNIQKTNLFEDLVACLIKYKGHYWVVSFTLHIVFKYKGQEAANTLVTLALLCFNTNGLNINS